MKAKNKIIGVSMFFSDVRQRNEKRKDRQEEKGCEREFGNQRTDKGSGLIPDLKKTSCRTERHFVLEGFFDCMLFRYLIKIIIPGIFLERPEEFGFGG
jgi:hypothetical protein